MTQERSFDAGFRMSVRDAIVIVVGAAAAVALATLVWWWGVAIAFVVAHFFLFCNVVRMARPLELAWAAVFVVLAVTTIALEVPGWSTTISISLVVTVALVARQLREPTYHGLGWQRINPGLRAWWEARQAERADSGV